MHTRAVLNNPGASIATTQARLWAGGNLRPGIGATDLQVGLSIPEVERVLKTPDKKVRCKDQLFYVYGSQGIDVDFGASQRVETLLFFDANVEQHFHRAPVHLNGIKLGSTRSLVVEHLGRPDMEGGPVRVGRRLKSWIYYNSGVQFDFDSRNRVIIIMVFAPTFKTSGSQRS